MSLKVIEEIECPGCKHKFDKTTDLSDLKNVPVTKIENKAKIKEVIEEGQTSQIIEKEKIVEKVKIPSDQPFYECKDCDSLHKNKNYSVRPNKKCNNCDSLNGPKNKGCKNCGNTEFEELDEDQLDDLGVPKPEEHEHEHEPSE